METIISNFHKISNFHTNFFIPEIQRLEFYLAHVCISGTNNCGESHQSLLGVRFRLSCITSRGDSSIREIRCVHRQSQTKDLG